MFRGSPVIDADAHKIENSVIFLEYLDTPYRERISLVADRYGEPRVAIRDRNPRTGKADFVRLFPQPDGFGKGAFRALHPETAMGALFHRVRLAHMEQEGIDVQVIYGSLSVTFSSLVDAELAVALCRAYNDYIRDDCEPYRSRLAPVGVLPLQDVSEAVAELRRCVEELGMPAVTVAPNLPRPHPDAPDAFPQVRVPVHLSDPRFFPLYEAAQELDVAIGIHGSPGVYLCGGSSDQVDTFVLSHVFGHRSQQQMALAKVVMDAVFDRFPRLRLGFLEAGCGWLPDLLHALEEHWEKRVRDFDPDRYRPRRTAFVFESLRDRNPTPRARLGRRLRNLFRYSPGRAQGRSEVTGKALESFLYEHRDLRHSPLEYFRRGQVFTTFESDDPAPEYLPAALGPLGEKLAGWSVDYGHWDGVLRGSVKRITQNPRISPDYAERLLSRNALEFYGWRLRERIEPYVRSQRKLLEGPRGESFASGR
ncbi:MAG: hypothetical protein KatS3mg076_1242 [Candidatus Binatia bacterium]|nr:MAG: hypothetical protein KatS3mg076_1242 [Candidatus Binatia bacterium]